MTPYWKRYALEVAAFVVAGFGGIFAWLARPWGLIPFLLFAACVFAHTAIMDLYRRVK